MHFSSWRPPHRVIALAIALATGACAQRTTAPAAVESGPPPQDSPGHLIARFAWFTMQADTTGYYDLFTGDFRFVEVRGDSEVAAPLSTVAFLIPPQPFVAVADPTPGMNPRWHRVITVHLYLFHPAPGDSALVATSQSPCRFSVVRGDSAALTPAQEAAGGRDSTRWYIRELRDESAHPASALRANRTGGGA